MGDLTLPLPAARNARGALTGRLDAARLRAAGDERLTRLAQAGDTRAFEAIFERHHQALYRYCGSIVRSPEDAADALQSAMLKAMLALPAKRVEVALKPWLYRIAHNEAVSILRRRRPHEEMTEARGPVTEGTEADAIGRARLRELLSDLDDLPERQRSAVVMRELNGLAFSDIGLAFGISPAAAKQAVYEARTALHERAEGRDMSCEAVRRSLSDGDGRIARGRRIRSHLSDCAGCRDFKEAIGARRGQLAALAPPIEVGVAATILHGLIGGGGGGAGGGLGGGLAVGVGKLGAASGVLKSAAVGVSLVAAAGAAGLAAGGGPNADPAAGLAPGPTSRAEPARSAPVSRLVPGPVPPLVPIAALRPLTDVADLGDRTPRDKRSPATREAPLVAALREERRGEADDGTATSRVPASRPPARRRPIAVDIPPPAVGAPRLPAIPQLPVDQPLPSPLGAAPEAPGVPGVEAPEVELPAPPVALPEVDIPAVPGELPK